MPVPSATLSAKEVAPIHRYVTSVVDLKHKSTFPGLKFLRKAQKNPRLFRLTVFVNMFDRNKIRPVQDFSGSSSFFTVEHFYEDGNRNIRPPISVLPN